MEFLIFFPFIVSAYTKTNILHNKPTFQKVGEQWKAEMKDLTSKFESKLREAQRRNKELKNKLEHVKVS